MPHFFVGDDAFAMRTYRMKPYGRRDVAAEYLQLQAVQARRVVEKGLWYSSLSVPVLPSGRDIRLWTSARWTRRMPITTSSLELGEMPPSLRGNRDTELANRQRDLFKYYFNSAGAVA